MNLLGAAGVLGSGVAILCIPLYFSAVLPVERALEGHHRAAERFKNRSPYRTVSANQGEAELRRFQNLFPPAARLTDELAHLYSLADIPKLDLQQGEYRLEDRGPGLTAYRVTLPIRGTYSQIREFIGAVLKDMPVASIDALRFERKKVDDAQIDAQVRLTIYFQPSMHADGP